MADATNLNICAIHALHNQSLPHTIGLEVVPQDVLCETMDWLERTDPTDEQELPFQNPFAPFLLENENYEPIRRILRSVTRRWNCLCILESPYLDLEFWDSHAGFYDRCFLSHSRHCYRFHFFSIPFAHGLSGEATDSLAASLITLLRRGMLLRDIRGEDGFQDLHYNGYMVLRPTLSFCVGRTALLFDDRSYADLVRACPEGESSVDEFFGLIPEEHRGQPFLKAGHTCDATIIGTKFRLWTPEFMQQDPNLGMCATVSLWVATHTCADVFGLNKFNYSTITRQALGGWNRDAEVHEILDPNGLDTGLFPSEMKNAIIKTGASPLAFPVLQEASAHPEALRLRQEIYSFVESGMPVILCLDENDEEIGEGHALVIVGHNLPSYKAVGKGYLTEASVLFARDGDAGGGVASNHFLVSTLVPLYYAHDDRYGPFNRVVFAGPDEQESDVNTSTCRFCPEESPCNAGNTKRTYPLVRVGGRHRTEMILREAIIPTPAIIRGGSCEKLKVLLTKFDELYLPGLEQQFGSGVKLLWRSLLVEGAEFKASIVRRHYAPKVIEWYGSLMLPKYVWLFEVSVVPTEEDWESHFQGKMREILGEFLYDPTTSRFDVRCLAYRFLDTGYDYRSNLGIDFEQELTPAIEFEEEDDPDSIFVYSCYTSRDQSEIFKDFMNARPKTTPKK